MVDRNIHIGIISARAKRGADEVRQALKGVQREAAQTRDAEIDITANTSGMRAGIAEVNRALGGISGTSAEIPIGFDTSTIDRETAELIRRIKREVDRNIGNGLSVEASLEIVTEAAAAEVGRILAELPDTVDIPVDLITDTVIAELRRVQAEAERLGGVGIPVSIETAEAEAQLRAAFQQTRDPIKIPVQMDDRAAEEDLRRILRQSRGSIELSVTADEVEAEREIREIIRRRRDPIELPVTANTDRANDVIDSLSNQTRNPVDVRISVDADQARAEIDKVSQQVPPAIEVPITADTTQATQQVGRLRDSLGRFLPRNGIEVPIRGDASGLVDAADEAEEAIERVEEAADRASRMASFRIDISDFLNSIRKAVSGLREVDDGAKKAADSADDMGRAFSSALQQDEVLEFAAEAVLAIATSIGEAITEFEDFQDALKAVTGAAVTSEAALAMIEEFAANTPFALADVTAAFVELKSAGIDSTKESLEAYGNVATGLNLTMEELGTAIREGVAGNFDKLNETQLKAVVSGDSVIFTYHGMQTQVANTADAIDDFLQQMGNTAFVGEMESAVDSMSASLLDLQKAWDEVGRDIGEGGLTEGMRDFADSMKRASENSDELAKAFGGFLGNQLTSTGRFIEEAIGLVKDFKHWLEELSDTIEGMPVVGNLASGLRQAANDMLPSIAGGAGAQQTPEGPQEDEFTAGIRREGLDTGKLGGFGSEVGAGKDGFFNDAFASPEKLKIQPFANDGIFLAAEEPGSRSLRTKSNSLTFRTEQTTKPPRNRTPRKSEEQRQAETFAREKKEGDELIRTLSLMDESYERGRGSVEGFRNSLEELNVRQQAQKTVGKQNAEVLVEQAMAARAYQEQIAFKGEVLNQQEAIQQTVALAEAQKEGSVAVMQAGAAQQAWNTAVQLGVSSSPELVQQLHDLAVEAEAANRFLALETDLSAMDQQIESAARMATAYREGGAAIREATLEEQVRAAAVQAGLEFDEVSVQKIRERMTALRELQEIQKSDEKSLMAEIDLGALEAELRMSQMIGEARYIEAERLDMLTQKKRELKDATATLTAEEEKQAAAMGRAKYAMDSQSTALDSIANSIPNFAYALEEAAGGALRSFEDALVDIITGAKSAREAFADMAKSIAADLARMAIRMAIIQPLAMMFGGMMGGGAAMMPVPIAHTGGIIGRDPLPTRSVPKFHTGGIVGDAPMMSTSPYASFPKFHTGGLAPSETPAILEKGEGVFTVEQMKALSPVNNNDNSARGITVVNNINVTAPPGGDRGAAESQANNIAKMVSMAVDERLVAAQRNGGILNANGGY